MLLVLGVAACQAAPSPQATIDSIITARMAEHGIPGVAYAVSRDGEIIHANAFGVADLRHGTPVTAATVFDLASLTKQFIAAGILILQEQGRLRLDDSLDRFIDDCPAVCQRITVRHLLTHTSGLAGLEENWPMMAERWGERIEYTDDQWLELLRTDTLRFEPGTRMLYSDLGYYLAGMVIQDASGMSTAEFLTTSIFEPVGMTETYTEDESRITPHEADGYMYRDSVLISNGRDWDRATIGSGGVFSTVGDLVKWDAALTRHTVLSEESTAMLFEWAPLANGTLSNYALGWYVNDLFGIGIQTHTGSTGTELIRIPDRGLFIVVLSNLDGADVGAREIARLLVPELAPTVPDTLPRADPLLEEYAGTFVSLGGVTSTVSIRDGRLHYAFGDQFEDELVAHGADRFLPRGVPDFHYRFMRNARGEIEALYLINHWFQDFPQVKVD